MKTTSIATAKNQFSRLVEYVKQGEAVLITERNRPVAKMHPVQHVDSQVASLLAQGVLSPPIKTAFDVAAFIHSLPNHPAAKTDASVLEALLEERREER